MAPQDDAYPIDQMPNLAERLGRSRIDRIRYSSKQNSFRQAGATNLENTVLASMQGRNPYDPFCPVSDILSGIARLQHDTGKSAKPLSTNRLYVMFQCMETINSREVMAMLDVSDRQARKYVKAAKLALPHLEQHFHQRGDAVEAPEVI